jgi:hypothetical protein
MRYRLDGAQKSAGRRALRYAAICGVLVTAAGCASNIETEGVGPGNPAPSITGGAPRNTGAYPNLNVRPEVAGQQFTPEEQAASRRGLGASGGAAKAGAATTTITPEERLRLLRLASDNGKTVLGEIEGKK